MRALQFPKVMEFLPVLLPRHFKQLISSGSQEVLGKIEEILRTHPWKLGFHKVSKTFASRSLILYKARFLRLDSFCISFKGKKFVWTSMSVYFSLSVTAKYKLLVSIGLMQ